MPFKTYQQKSYLVIEFTRSLLFTADVLKDVQPKLYSLLEDPQHRKAVLDLSKVREISSQFIGTIVAIHTRLAKRGGKLVLVGLNDKLAELMSITRLDRIITILPSVSDAVDRDAFL